MSLVAELVEEARGAGIVLSRKGEKIHLDSPLGLPLSAELRERLRAHRQELLAYLDYCEHADVLLLSVSVRLAEAYPHGCPLEGAEWRAAEEALQVAYRSQDLEKLAHALVAYEAFAEHVFYDYSRRVR
jgi:hypothetical protein